MSRITTASLLIFAFIASSCTPSGSPEILRTHLEQEVEGGVITSTGARLFSADSLAAFYGARDFDPIWVDADGMLPRAEELMASLSRSGVDGLDPSGYRLEEIAILIARIESDPTSEDLAELELLLSDAFLAYGSHLRDGKVNPETLEPEWPASHGQTSMVPVLDAAVRSGDVRRALDELAPPQDRYDIMKAQMARLNELGKEEWERVPDGGKLEKGATSPRVQAVRRRLELWGDVSPGDEVRADSFDSDLEQGLRRFQSRHGLEDDGVVGPATLRALNVSPVQRMRQLAVNMERWRRLPADLGSRFIEVNIAGFLVNVVEDGQIVQTHRAVVGQQYRQTPTFSATMDYLVLAPYWNVPASIAGNDKLPLIRQDRSYLEQQHMKILRRDGNEEVDPDDIDWDEISVDEFNDTYWIRQDPGPLNALGNIKFMFPNKHNVYLHDTPSRGLFDLASRSFSSGCIRVQNPLELAEYLLKDDPQWNRERMLRVINQGVEESVPLQNPIPVHLLYWTAWVDSDGLLQFREDIYERDTILWNALIQQPPTS